MNCKIVSLPARGDVNPYVDLFYDSLLPHGIELVGPLVFDQQWLEENTDRFDAIHLHWPENLWRNFTNPLLEWLRYSDIPGTWRLSQALEKRFVNLFNKERLKWFSETIKIVKAHKKKIIWTWHNLEPHDNVSKLDFSGNQVLAENADLIIFHSAWAEVQCRKKHFITANTVIMPHGNYDGVYPSPRDRSQVMGELGLDQKKPVVGFLGAIRAYKGLDVACEALEILGDTVQFLCAGNPHPSFDFDALSNNLAKINGAVVVPRMISDQEFSDYANACEILLLPYKEVTGSGALLAALSLGKGIVASDLPFFREVLEGFPSAGILVKPNDPSALASGICKSLEISADVRTKSARTVADNFSWNKVVKPVVEAIKLL